mgnify:CR=1 FL=1
MLLWGLLVNLGGLLAAIAVALEIGISNDAIRNINEYGTSLRNTAVSTPRKASDEFGSLTFNEEVQRGRLPKDVYKRLQKTLADEKEHLLSVKERWESERRAIAGVRRLRFGNRFPETVLL